ncbi:MAG: S8 family serine peptidase [Candidatus Woesearchaeota archaeon]|jgi:subtilisin family serine protease
MRKFILKIIIVLFIVVLIVPEVYSKTSQDVLNELQQQEKVRVVVLLKDNLQGTKSTTQISAAVKLNQKVRSSVIDKIGDGKIFSEFQSRNGFSATLNADDIRILEEDLNVESIYIDKKVHAFLQNSTVKINATDVWSLTPFNINLTGIGRTVCIIDTGVNYTHSDLGNCTISNLNLLGERETILVESVHNYSNYENTSWVINKSGFSRMAIHFVNISTERGWDFITILDSNNNRVASYSGTYNDLWTPSVEGDNITILFESDGSTVDYGFYADEVINGTTEQTYNWSNCTKVLSGWDFVNGDANPIDDYLIIGHGTHVAGIVSANGRMKGVAPESNIVFMKTLDSNGNGYLSDTTKAIEWCVNRSSEFNISVISLSLGDYASSSSSYCDATDEIITAAINSAVNKNILVTIATGNEGDTSKVSFPACIKNATRVGSTNINDVPSTYNRWNKDMLFAPGEYINSTGINGEYRFLSGTSMATPHVAGAILLLQQYWLEQNGTLPSKDLIFIALNSTGNFVYDSGVGINITRINVIQALNYLDEDVPTVSITKSTNSSLHLNESEINITWLVEDRLWVQFSEFNISYPNGSLMFTSNSSNGSIYLNLSNLTNTGVYSLKLYGKDRNNNSADANSTFSMENNAVEFNSSRTISDFSWVQKTELLDQFNLIDYFYDPDGDTLSYELNNATDVTMSVTNNVVSFYSPTNYYGVEYVWITATDSLTVNSSNIFVLNITQASSRRGGGGGSSWRPPSNTSVVLISNISVNGSFIDGNLTLNESNLSNITLEDNLSEGNFTFENISNITLERSINKSEKTMHAIEDGLQLNDENKELNLAQTTKTFENFSNNLNATKKISKLKVNIMNPQIIVKALAGIAAIIAILLVITILNKMAKKRAEKMSAEFNEEMKKQKAEEKKLKEEKKKEKK